MNRFAELLDRLAYEPARNNKLRLMTEYFRSTGDPERGWALAALTGALSFPHAKPGLIRNLIAERTDPVLFELSYDYVGDLSETVALMWPQSPATPLAQRTPSPLVGEGCGRGSGGLRTAEGLRSADGLRPAGRTRRARPPPLSPPHKGEGKSKRRASITLSSVIETLTTLGKAQLPQQLGALARRARRDRPLGADQARHRRLAGRRFGAARQGRGRGARPPATRRRSSCSGPGSRRPMSSCSPGSKAGRKNRRAAIRRRSGRRCWPMRSTMPTSRRSIRPIFWPNGNGTASACRRLLRPRHPAAEGG